MEITPHLYERISTRSLDFALHDLRDLRAKVRNSAVDLPWSMINSMKRQSLVRMLLVNAFDADLIDKYYAQCKEWDEMRSFVEYGIDPNKKRGKRDANDHN